MRERRAASKGGAYPPQSILARLGRWTKVEAQGSGSIVADFNGESIRLGTFGAAAVECLHGLRTGLPLEALNPESGQTGKEIGLLVRRLAACGLLEYRIGHADGRPHDLVVIEAQSPSYWPKPQLLKDVDSLVLSRFAYLRRRGDGMVLESPRSGALFRLCDARLAGLVAMLSAPQTIADLRRQDGFPGLEFFGLLAECEIAFKTESDGAGNARLAEGDQDLALWDFHDLLFHVRSTEGRHANPIGGTYPHGGLISPIPAVRPPWPGKTIDLNAALASDEAPMPKLADLLRDRRSTRSFDNAHPVTLAELSRFLDGVARVQPQRREGADGDADVLENARPYPSAGGSWELELYLAVNSCEGLPQGFYHYDAAAHALVALEARLSEVQTLLMAAADAMGAPAAPQILITIAARFGRVSWKYSSIAYSLILKDAGVLTQTLYLMAAEMGLGGCAIGIANVDQFEKMTGIGFHVEGPVGQFALGRAAPPKAAADDRAAMPVGS